jgi:hypothetical protein
MDVAETAGLPSFHKIWTPVNGQNGRSATREHRVSVKLVSDAAYPKSKARPVTGIPLIYAGNKRADERTRTADLTSLRVRFGLPYLSRKVVYLHGKVAAAYRRVTPNYVQVSVPVSVSW